ncbi:MAG: hypothetical protein M9894_39690 [Planctomycetes bacterium]|nr:hypothetical protein [Planctomycetota bacterium]
MSVTWQMAEASIVPHVVDGEMLAEDSGNLVGRRSGVFRASLDGRPVFVFMDVDAASNGLFVDVAMARSLDEVEARLRARAAEVNHASAEFDAADAEAIERARAALAAGVTS